MTIGTYLVTLSLRFYVLMISLKIKSEVKISNWLYILQCKTHSVFKKCTLVEDHDEQIYEYWHISLIIFDMSMYITYCGCHIFTKK